MMSGLSSVKWIVIAGAVTAAIGAFWYISGLRADLQQSQQNVVTLKSSVEEQQSVIEQIRADQEQITQLRSQLNSVVRQQEEEINALRNRFDRSSSGKKRDIGTLAVAKPGLVQDIITNASTEATRCVEIASGAELTQGEQNAVSRGEINSECPSLANPSYSPDD